MAKKEYAYGSRTPITEHFHSSEFDCKCGKHHNTIIDTDLVNLLEDLRSQENVLKVVIVSGHRCAEHNAKVGGAETSPHINGEGADINVYTKDGKKMLSKNVCLILEDMGHQYGIGYRSGNNIYETHVDIKKRGYKYYFDEGYKPYKTIVNFHDDFGVPKTKKTYTGTFPTLPNTLIGNYVRNNVSSKDNIKNLQSFLNWALNEKLVVDGVIGVKTTDAIKQFQKKVGIKDDGKFGKNSLAKAKEFTK